MDWFGADIAAPLVAARGVHLAASAITAGVLIFGATVLAPAASPMPQARVIGSRLRRVIWLALAVDVVSGFVWFVLQAASMSGLAPGEAIAPDVLWTVLVETQFGQVMLARLLCLIVLAACLGLDGIAAMQRLALAAALGFVGAIAWTGHAGATAGGEGAVHVAADVLHLWAAAAWTGGLLGLVLLLVALGRGPEARAAIMVAVRRFSILGLASVGTLLVSGAIHSWILVGSLHVLLVTAYGRLLIIKLALFALMLALATINRLWLTPRLATASTERATAMLISTAAIELVFAIAVFALVGALGTQHPAAHFLTA
ncbi:copper homeostasis membrane protein CopD [Bradyrhizobium sp. STM 3557]|uniref:copper homeostasis membrane protein CopD n=1 Tax=Bradyrhizobium sp. STM 3557 TaxID=578920 RepID=UPI00388F462F